MLRKLAAAAAVVVAGLTMAGTAPAHPQPGSSQTCSTMNVGGTRHH